MGGAPIFIDDGGSIRIKLASQNPNLNGEMESLFNVNNNGQSEHKIDPAYGTYDEVLIFWLDATGVMPSTTPITRKFKTVTISGNVGPKIEVTNNPINKITVSGGPFIESKQHRNKRSYTVLNGGHIETIEIKNPPGNDRRVDIPHDAIYAGLVIT